MLIVDDHASFRSLARRLLVAEGFDVVGEAGDAADAFVAVRSLAPDVVLLDIRLPDLDGFGVAEVLAGDEDAPAVVLVSSRSRGDYGPRVDASPRPRVHREARPDGGCAAGCAERGRREAPG